MSDHHTTRLLSVTDEGQVELITEDPAVIHKARQAHANKVNLTFVYSSRDAAEETTTGRVVWISDEPEFRFAIEADDDDAAIVRKGTTENQPGTEQRLNADPPVERNPDGSAMPVRRLQSEYQSPVEAAHLGSVAGGSVKDPENEAEIPAPMPESLRGSSTTQEERKDKAGQQAGTEKTGIDRHGV